MATTYWLGTAIAVAQLNTITVGGTLAGETFNILVNGKIIATFTDSDTVIATTVAGLVAAWNLSTIAYATGITAADASPDVTLTGDTAGIPFIVTLNTPGGSATFANVVTTAATGPNHWSDATNWSEGSVPVSTDTIIIQDNSINILWDIDQNAVDLTKMSIPKSYTGKIGLDYRVFTTSGALATDATEVEYRDIYLKIGSTTVDIGQDFSTGDPAGSARILLDLDTTVSTVSIFGTASTSSETGRPAIRLKGVNGSNNLFVRSAPGGVGIAIDTPNEVSTFSKVSVSDTSSGSKVEIGAGTTLTTFEQNGGINILQVITAGTLTTLTMEGGTLTTEGDYIITTANVNSGTLLANHIKSGGDAIATLNIDNGATVDGRGSNDARTWTTVNLKRGGTIAADSNFVTITTLNEPTGPYVIKVS